MLTSNHLRHLILTSAWAAILAGAGCSSGASTTGTGGASSHASSSGSTSTGGPATTGSGGSSGSSGSGGSGGGGMLCPGPGFPGAGVSLTPASAKAKIVDETGAPVAGQPIYICGTNICSSPQTSQADGTVTISNNAGHMTDPAFKFGDTVDYAEFAIPLTTATTDFTNGGTMVLATGKLSDKPGAALTPGGSATSGDVTITIPAGGSVGVDGIIYDTPDAQKLHTVTIPLTNLGQVLAPVMVNGQAANFSLVYGVRPAETLLCPAAKVTVALPHKNMTPNDLSWAAGTMVEFWVMTTDTGQVYAPYGGWAKMSDGVVSADGTTVSTVDGGGFIFLENFAIRLKT